MYPTSERELKLDIGGDVAPKLIKYIPDLIMRNSWPGKGRFDVINFDRYFDQLLKSGLFALHSIDAYVRVRKSVWPQKEREAEFIAYRKLNEAAYGRPAEIYDNEMSVLKIKEITDELLKDHPDKLIPPAHEAIGPIENLESMGLSEIIRLTCERSVFPISYTENPADQVKIKVDRVVYKSRPLEVFTQLEIDYYSNELFDVAATIMKSVTMALRDLTGVDCIISTTSKMTRGIQLL